jgi:hypothetical protein
VVLREKAAEARIAPPAEGVEFRPEGVARTDRGPAAIRTEHFLEKDVVVFRDTLGELDEVALAEVLDDGA